MNNEERKFYSDLENHMIAWKINTNLYRWIMSDPMYYLGYKRALDLCQ